MHPFLTLLLRLMLGAVWLAASTSRLARKEQDGPYVTDFDLLPAPVALLLGIALPWIELTLGLLLLSGKWSVFAATASAALLLVFTIAIVINLARGRTIECRCFGQMSRAPISGLSVVRNAGLVVAALLIALNRSDLLSLDGWQRGAGLLPASPPLIEFVPVLLLMATVGLLWALLVSAWQAAQAIAEASGGPALGLSERRVFRRWMRLQEEEKTEGIGS